MSIRTRGARCAATDGAVGGVPSREPETSRCLSWPPSCGAPQWPVFRPGLCHRYDGLPAKDHCGESDLPARGAKGVPTPVLLCPPPCSATTRRARRGQAGRPPTALYPKGFGESVPTHAQWGLPGTAWTTTARGCPLIVQTCNCQNRASPGCSTPLCSRVTHTTARP